jgi:hypothetical protein
MDRIITKKPGGFVFSFIAGAIIGVFGMIYFYVPKCTPVQKIDPEKLLYDTVSRGSFLYLNEPVEVLKINYGSFMAKTGGKWVYVIDKSGKRVVKKEITLGRISGRQIEIVDGLEEGDVVIISSYNSLNPARRLIFK